MMRAVVAIAAATLTCLPSTAFAQATADHWSAVYTGPILAGAGLVAMGIGALFSLHPLLSKLGVLLWLLLATAAGCLMIYSMQGAALGKPWQLPAFSAGVLAFVFAGNWALVRLKRA